MNYGALLKRPQKDYETAQLTSQMGARSQGCLQLHQNFSRLLHNPNISKQAIKYSLFTIIFCPVPFTIHPSDHLLYPVGLLCSFYTKDCPKMVYLEGRLAALVCDSQSGSNDPPSSEIKIHKLNTIASIKSTSTLHTKKSITGYMGQVCT